MITSTKGNGPAYKALFADAAQYLYTHNSDRAEVALGSADALLPAVKMTDENGDVVTDEGGNELFLPLSEQPPLTSLEEYFSFIVELQDANRVYTILPLDEPAFDIDTNTRQITIPDTFATNGVAIQGDEIAEILYFRAPRYFDATDLSKKEIYIQWAAANGDEGVSLPWVIDINSEPGFIIFGWPLSTKVTKTPGTVTFSCRFYSIDQATKKVNYSLATEPATITVKPSLDYNLTTLQTDGKVIDDSNALIARRFENTTPGNSTSSAEYPFFLLDFNVIAQKTAQGTYTITDEDTGITVTAIDADLDEDAAGFRKIDFDAAVEATSNDGGNITYMGTKFDYYTLSATENVETALKMIPTTDTTVDPQKVYYYNVPVDGVDSYKIYKNSQSSSLDSSSLDEFFQNIAGATDKKIYEKVFTIKIDGIGRYVITAKNRVRTDSKTKDSIIIFVKPPLAPKFDEGGNLDIKTVSKTIYEQFANYELNNSEKYPLGFTGLKINEIAAMGELATVQVPSNIIYDPGITRGGFGTDINVVTEVDDRGKQTFKWFYIAPGATTPVELTETTANLHIKGYNKYATRYKDENDKENTAYTAYTIDDPDTGIATGDGYYYCQITNNLNKEIEMVESKKIRISHAASTPKITTQSENAYSWNEIERGETLDVEATITAQSELIEGWRTDKDEITYEWFQYKVADGTTLQADQALALDHKYVPSGDVSMWYQADYDLKQLNLAYAAHENDMTEAEYNARKAIYEARMANALEASFKPYDIGVYYCVATNKYNGTQASILSEFFTVSPA